MGEEIREEEAFAGNIKIADDVIACIAMLAATDVKGVAGMASTAAGDLRAVFGKNVVKGVKLELDEDEVKLTLAISAEYGYSLPEVSKDVQKKVKSTVENMTGLTVSEVNVSIAGIDVPESE